MSAAHTPVLPPRNSDEIRSLFGVLANGQALQTAIMRLKQGEESGSYGNEHPESEQTLFVIAGKIEAEIAGETWTMRTGDSVIVPKDAPHRFSNASSKEVVTFNVYGPPAY